MAGAGSYTLANWYLTTQGAQHRKRSGKQQAAENGQNGGLAIAVGALLDGIPESIVIGISLISGATVSWVTVAAVFLSNIPGSNGFC